MITVAITAPTGCASINTAGLMDALCKTDRAWRMARDPDAQAIFEVRLAGLDERPIACRDGVVMHPHVAAAQLDPPDLVVVPGLDDDLEPSFQLNRTWVPWIARWHAAGARVASSCTGAFLAAAAGVLDGKEALTLVIYLTERYGSHDPGGAGLQGDADRRRAPKPTALRRCRPLSRARRPAHPL